MFDLTEVTKKVFRDTGMSPDNVIRQDFVSVMTMIHAWKSAVTELSDTDTHRYKALATGKRTNGKAEKPQKEDSALFHLSIAKREYDRLVDKVLDIETTSADSALENLQEVYKDEITFLNKIKYKHPSSSPTSKRGHHPRGKMRQP